MIIAMVTIYSGSEQEIFVVLDLFYLVTADAWDYWQSNVIPNIVCGEKSTSPKV